MRPADWMLIGTVRYDENAIFGTSPASKAVSDLYLASIPRSTVKSELSSRRGHPP
jgi:hypothetical protein